MQPGSGSAHPTSLSEEVDVPGRPDFIDRFVQGNRPIPATAVRAVTPERERRTSRPETAVVYLPFPSPPPDMLYFARCFAYAYITPEGAPCKANPAPFIRAAFGAALPGLRFELTPPAHGADRTVRFPTPGGPGGGHGAAAVRAGRRVGEARPRGGDEQRPARQPGHPRPRRAAGLPPRAAEPRGHPRQLLRLRAPAGGRPGLLRRARPLPRARRPRDGGASTSGTSRGSSGSGTPISGLATSCRSGSSGSGISPSPPTPTGRTCPCTPPRRRRSPPLTVMAKK
ncbi:hypothetical protein C2845_PM01G32620 [Panicum miliaceum]|uniref:Uncharacterized protein n=1 Tax=Panicum miliaceum TaxID=4540 RepID=A0A3L6THG0_PANMI|nr:hypothetical protein C2845_PM01G32620 [Panicum miliaceum]